MPAGAPIGATVRSIARESADQQRHSAVPEFLGCGL
jgi:hypothetical protein